MGLLGDLKGECVCEWRIKKRRKSHGMIKDVEDLIPHPKKPFNNFIIVIQFLAEYPWKGGRSFVLARPGQAENETQIYPEINFICIFISFRIQ